MSLPSPSNHNETRQLLRVVGPVLLGLGGLLTLIGLGSFFSSFGSFQMPQYFWCAFVGMPLIAAGAALSKFAYLGAMTRYVANEVAPVGKDVVNYMAKETKGSVKEVAEAVASGLRSGMQSADAPPLECPSCRAQNDANARFCKKCGTVLYDKILCSNCGQQCSCDSQFCTECGKAVA